MTQSVLGCLCFLSSSTDSPVQEKDQLNHIKYWQGFAIDLTTNSCIAGMLAKPAQNPPELHACCIPHPSDACEEAFEDTLFWDVEYRDYTLSRTTLIQNVQQLSQGDAVRLSTEWSAVVPRKRDSKDRPCTSHNDSHLISCDGSQLKFTTDLVLVGADAAKYIDRYFPSVPKGQESHICLGKLEFTV